MQQISALDDAIGGSDGFFQWRHISNRVTIHSHRWIKKWERKGLNCNNDLLAVMCANENDMWNGQWISGWRAVSISHFDEIHFSIIEILFTIILI